MESERSAESPSAGGRASREVTLCLAGDVMIGRGVDQVLPRSVDPALRERHVKDARRYVELAEMESGPIPAPADVGHVWGDALEEIGARGPEATIVNLETAVTTHGVPWKGKGIHYRTHPANVAVLEAGGVDVCVLANNHVLDWGREGLDETLASLREAGLATAGAGRDLADARSPAVLEIGDGEGGRRRVLVVAYGSPTAGVPGDWAAAEDRSGVALLEDIDAAAARDVAGRVRDLRRPGDVVVVSLHWGRNWGYRVPERQRRFARVLVEEGGVDVVHGHSSHHPRGMEVRDGRPILYGCGDLINDYEGIAGHASFRPGLALLYFVGVGTDGASGSSGAGAGGPASAAGGEPTPGPASAPETGRSRPPPTVEAVPFRRRRFRLERAGGDDARWLAGTLDRESRKLGARVEMTGDGTLRVRGGDSG